jgi:UPF0755 protein
MSEMRKRFIIFVGILTLIFILLVCGMVSFFTRKTKILKNDVIVTIEKNSGAKKIASILKENGVIKSEFFFLWHIKSKGAATQLKPGRYKFPKGKVTFDSVLAVLLKGEQEEQVTITIPEGYTVKQIAELLEQKGLTTKDEFLDYITGLTELPYDYIEITGDYRQLEGFLFPDTYQIPTSWNNEKIVNKLLNEFDKNWTSEYRERAKELNLTTREIITIASLIEREARVDSERAKISSVIHNRLKKKMLLQIDATVQYLLPEQKERLLYKDLEIDSPYNTYKYIGLPPTAIAAPGFASIKAALYPEDTDYYYYRAKTSGNGEHWFTETLEEHNSYKGK